MSESWLDLLPAEVVERMRRIIAALGSGATAEGEAAADPERAELYRGIAAVAEQDRKDAVQAMLYGRGEDGQPNSEPEPGDPLPRGFFHL